MLIVIAECDSGPLNFRKLFNGLIDGVNRIRVVYSESSIKELNNYYIYYY